MSSIQRILELYYVENKSIREIAKEFDTYPNRIRRQIIETGRALRTKSEAQKEALKSGRHTHPTLGKKHSQKTKDKIGKSSVECWENLTPEEIKHRKKIGKESWDKKTHEEKDAFKKKAHKELIRSSKEGSKLEKFLRDKLTDAGYNITYHQSHLLENERLHVDIMINNLGIALEIDGPSHTSPIFGQDALAKSQKADSQKNGLLINAGLKIIRIRYRKSTSKYYMDTLWSGLELCLEKADYLKPLTYLGEESKNENESV